MKKRLNVKWKLMEDWAKLRILIDDHRHELGEEAYGKLHEIIRRKFERTMRLKEPEE